MKQDLRSKNGGTWWQIACNCSQLLFSMLVDVWLGKPPPPLSFSLFISLSIFPFPLLKKKITQNALGVEFPVFLFDPKIHIVAAYAAHLHRSLTTEIYMIQ